MRAVIFTALNGVFKFYQKEVKEQIVRKKSAYYTYGTVVIPARVRKPKDKAKVETGVQIVERWILARLRIRQFFSLRQLNQAIAQLLEDLNNKPFQKLPGTRKSAFESIDRPALNPLPCQPYQFAEWKKATVNVDYHIDGERHYYSVPHTLIKKKIDVRITNNTIECFYKSKRVAVTSAVTIRLVGSYQGRTPTIKA